MMRHFDMKRYPRERGKNLYTTLGRRLFKGGDYSRGATIQGNTVFQNISIYFSYELNCNYLSNILDLL